MRRCVSEWNGYQAQGLHCSTMCYDAPPTVTAGWSHLEGVITRERTWKGMKVMVSVLSSRGGGGSDGLRKCAASLPINSLQRLTQKETSSAVGPTMCTTRTYGGRGGGGAGLGVGGGESTGPDPTPRE